MVHGTVSDSYIPFLAQYSEDLEVIETLSETRITEVNDETTDDD